jgi:hypothetical protein
LAFQPAAITAIGPPRTGFLLSVICPFTLERHVFCIRVSAEDELPALQSLRAASTVLDNQRGYDIDEMAVGAISFQYGI